MADTGKIAKNLERFAQAVAAHDRENPTHTAYRHRALRTSTCERLGLEEGEEILPGITIAGRRRRERELPRALRRRARRAGAGAHRGGGRRGGRDAVDVRRPPQTGPPSARRLRNRIRPWHGRRSVRRAAVAPAARRLAAGGRHRGLGHAGALARSARPAARSSGSCRPWRAAARSTAPGIASSSGSRPAAMSRCIELPSVAWAMLELARSPSPGSTSLAPSARPTAQASSIAPSRSARSAGVSRISPSSLS